MKWYYWVLLFVVVAVLALVAIEVIRWTLRRYRTKKHVKRIMANGLTLPANWRDYGKERANRLESEEEETENADTGDGNA